MSIKEQLVEMIRERKIIFRDDKAREELLIILDPKYGS